MYSVPQTPSAISDVVAGLRSWRLAAFLAWQDIRQRYRRSTIGPFWITISTAITMLAMAMVFGQILSVPMSDFLPFLCVGLILWSLIQAVVEEGCAGFTTADQTIKQIPLPLFVHIERIILRNLTILAHNAVIIPIVLLACGKQFDWTALLCIPGLILFTLSLSWVALFLAIACTRYRDVAQIIRNFLQVAFYFTPIIWTPGALSHQSRLFLVETNPLYHHIEIVRGPLLGIVPSLTSWLVAIGTVVVGWIVTIFLFQCTRSRIAYWL